MRDRVEYEATGRAITARKSHGKLDCCTLIRHIIASSDSSGLGCEMRLCWTEDGTRHHVDTYALAQKPPASSRLRDTAACCSPRR